MYARHGESWDIEQTNVHASTLDLSRKKHTSEINQFAMLAVSRSLQKVQSVGKANTTDIAFRTSFAISNLEHNLFPAGCRLAFNEVLQF